MGCPDESQLLSEQTCQLKQLLDLAEQALTEDLHSVAAAALATAARHSHAVAGAVLDLATAGRVRVVAATGAVPWRLGEEFPVVKEGEWWNTSAANHRRIDALGPSRVQPLVVRSSPIGALALFGATAPADEFLDRIGSILGQSLDRHHAQEAARYDSLHDRLTGLPNRALLMQRIETAIRGVGVATPTVTVVFIDIDDFKLVNDALSHEAGDQLLAGIGARLQHAVRADDIVGRFAGDEFVVLLHGVADVAHAEALAERISNVFALPLVVGERDARITASIGVVVETDPSTTAERLLAAADAAMYHAKRAGRGHCVRFDESMADDARDRLAMSTDLRCAVRRDQLEVWFQPYVDVAGAPLGAEALVRWRHPDRGLVSPSEFIPLAEQIGVIDELGAWVLDTALRAAGQWPSRSDGSRYVVSVNVSTHQISPRLMGIISDAVRSNGVPFSQVMIEFTESALAEGIAIRSLAEQLLRRGAGVAIDDFGTGESSLGRLQRFVFTELKIDQSFVRELVRDTRVQAIVSSVITLAEALGASVIAEGVETEEQRAVLASMGCSALQGYLIARPMPAADFQRWLSDRASAGFASGLVPATTTEETITR